MDEQAETFHAVIGTALRKWREERKERQEIVALCARRWGLPWTPNIVAQIETGRRHVTIEEWFLLPRVMSELSSAPCNWADLLPAEGPERVAITPNTTARRKALRYLVAHAGGADTDTQEDFDTPAKRHVEAWQTTPVMQAADVRYLVTEPDRKAARKLGTKASTIALCAWKLWGRSLTQERERQLVLAGHELADMRSAQALRGSITRKLIAELKPLVKPKKKGGAKSVTIRRKHK